MDSSASGTAVRQARTPTGRDGRRPSRPRLRRGNGEPWWRRRQTLLCLLFVGLLFALPLRGLLRSQGPPMEEGFMLVFPERVLAGDVPNRDFLHLYGPGSLWVLAGAFKVFGTSLTAERLVALAQQVALVLAVFTLALRWGRTTAVVAAVVCTVVILPPIGLTALAWVGAMALGLWAVWAALRARDAGAQPHGRRWALVSGLLAGIALLYRPDIVLATGGGIAVALWRSDRARVGRLLTGLALGLSPYVVHAAMAGPVTAFRGMALDPVVYLRGGRRLPIPPSPSGIAGFLQRAGETYLLEWPLPTPTTAVQLAVWFWLMIAAVIFVLAAGTWSLRRVPGSSRARVLLAVGVFCVGLLPQGIQRVDSTHFAWASAVSLAFVPVALLEVTRRIHRLGSTGRALLAGTVALVVLFVAIPTFTARRWTDFTVQTFGYNRLAFEISYRGRTFYYGRKDVAEAVEEMLPVAERIAPSGGKLFVGTGDLRKTPYSDAFLYYMLPDLEPATYFIEMDPGVANREGSGLAEDLASADVAILSTVWDNWDEPNDSRKIGSAAPNRVLRERFCLVAEYGGGLYRLYDRVDGRPAPGTCPR